MGISSRTLCQRLKSEAIAKQDTGIDNQLRLRILDFLIDRDLADDMFEEILKARLNDPDPDKERSKIICSQILEAWHDRSDEFNDQARR